MSSHTVPTLSASFRLKFPMTSTNGKDGNQLPLLKSLYGAEDPTGELLMIIETVQSTVYLRFELHFREDFSAKMFAGIT